MSDESSWEAKNHAATQLHLQGRYAEAENLFVAALEEVEQSGQEDLRLALVLNNLANLYHNQKKYDRAEPLYRRALAIREAQLEPTHLLVAQSLNNLAALCRDRSQYAEAENLIKRSLAIKENLHGSRHMSLTNSINTLAAIYGDQSRYAEAEELFKRSLDIRQDAFGSHHPSVASSLVGLGETYADQGRYPEARAVFERALRIREEALGPEHPAVAAALEAEARLLRKMEREAEAQEVEARAQAIRELHPLGRNDPETLSPQVQAAFLAGTISSSWIRMPSGSSANALRMVPSLVLARTCGAAANFSGPPLGLEVFIHRVESFDPETHMRDADLIDLDASAGRRLAFRRDDDHDRGVFGHAVGPLSCSAVIVDRGGFDKDSTTFETNSSAGWQI